jgi:hypothetical protein
MDFLDESLLSVITTAPHDYGLRNRRRMLVEQTQTG